MVWFVEGTSSIDDRWLRESLSRFKAGWEIKIIGAYGERYGVIDHESRTCGGRNLVSQIVKWSPRHSAAELRSNDLSILLPLIL